MYWNGHMSTGGWILSVVWTLIVFALVAAAIVWALSMLSNRDRRFKAPNASEASPREILDRRLASGDLTVEQYKHLREAMEDSDQAPGETGRPASIAAHV
jgi:uncharacterized membrane protein